MGLLLLRVAVAIGVALDVLASPGGLDALQWLTIAVAALLVIGMWTPVTGVLLAIVELGLAFARPDATRCRALLCAFAACLAMLGPGGWSIDARLFGRKRIRIPDPEN